MVGQDREEANRLQQAKWELTSRIRDESNVPNAFHFSARLPFARQQCEHRALRVEALDDSALAGNLHRAIDDLEACSGQRRNWLAGHVGLELRNPCASHVFEIS
jgi:hypothetical protein